MGPETTISNTAARMFERMHLALQSDGTGHGIGNSTAGESASGTVEFSGCGTTASLFPVSDFAQGAIATAIAEVQTLRQRVWGATGAARIDRVLCSAWCSRSVYPDGWKLPSMWDDFAGDYQAQDGWIRLHTNAPAHRSAALAVLGQPATRTEAIEKVRHWNTSELEQAVVDQGGAAALMMSREQWTNHPQGIAVQQEPVVAWTSRKTASQTDDALQLSSSSRPLQGIKVLDLTRVLAGPVCTRFLASLGADVLRIDPPHWNEESLAPEVTIGKHCAELDLTQPSDVQVFKSLLARADVIVHGYRRDALDALGVGQEMRAALNPDLIDVALNAYGWSGPWTCRRGFDSLVQMSSGIAQAGMRAAGADKPVPLPFQALDHVTGYLMAAAVVHAVTRRVCDEQILTARLSLARQAHLLSELSELSDEQLSGSKPAPGAGHRPPELSPELTPDYFSEKPEQTPWGPLSRLCLPYVVEGLDTRFDHPANRLHSAPACWAD